MSDGLAPARYQKLRGLKSCDQYDAPYFLTLLAVTRSAHGELQQHGVGMRKVQVGGTPPKKRPVRKSRDGPFRLRIGGA